MRMPRLFDNKKRISETGPSSGKTESQSNWANTEEIRDKPFQEMAEDLASWTIHSFHWSEAI